MNSVKVDKKLLKTYCIGIIMHELLCRYSPSERFGATQKIYNSIQKKHDNFEKQIIELHQKKRKKVSDKTLTYSVADKLENEVWTEVVGGAIQDQTIIINGVLKTMAFREQEELKRIYQLDYNTVFCALPLQGSGKIKDGIINMDSIRFAKKLILTVDKKIAEITI